VLYPLFVIQVGDSQPKIFVWCLEYCSWEGPHIPCGWESLLVAWCHDLVTLGQCKHHCWEYIVYLAEDGQCEVKPCHYFVQVAGAGIVGPLSGFLQENVNLCFVVAIWSQVHT